jgi:hypothetical protein
MVRILSFYPKKMPRRTIGPDLRIKSKDVDTFIQNNTKIAKLKLIKSK